MLKLTRSNTNQTIVDMHHDLFDVSPPITLDEFHHYLYWHNRGWGNQTQTVEMVVSTAPLNLCLAHFHRLNSAFASMPLLLLELKM